MNRGAIFWLDLEVEGRRPVCILTRDAAIPGLRNVVVALVTTRIRGLVSEVPLGPEDGMPRECAISLDNVRTVPKAQLAEDASALHRSSIRSDPSLVISRERMLTERGIDTDPCN